MFSAPVESTPSAKNDATLVMTKMMSNMRWIGTLSTKAVKMAIMGMVINACNTNRKGKNSNPTWVRNAALIMFDDQTVPTAKIKNVANKYTTRPSSCERMLMRRATTWLVELKDFLHGMHLCLRVR